MSGKKTKQSEAKCSQQGLRMKELTEATGLPKSTILHYVAQGLLPEPLKTSPNMAYYDPACIERAKYIKTIQNTYAFPLGKIRTLLSLKDQGKDETPLIQLNEAIFGKAEGTTVDKATFLQITGLTSGQLSELLQEKLIIPLEDGLFNQDDIAAGHVYAGAFEFGIKASDLAFYPALAEEIVDNEMHLRQRLTAHLPDDLDAQFTRRLVEGGNVLRNYTINRAFQHRVAAAKDLKDEALLS